MTQYTNEELLACLRRLAQGESTLGRRTYEQRRGSGDPSPHLFQHRFGSWNRALSLAGLDTVEQPIQLQGAAVIWSDVAMVEALLACLDESGEVTFRAYDAWQRRGQPSRPPATSIRARFGRWTNATEAMGALRPAHHRRRASAAG